MRSRTQSFVADFPLRTTAAEERNLEIGLDAARNVDNASLSVSPKRLDAMRASTEWKQPVLRPRAS
jgi:hypothetical protein